MERRNISITYLRALAAVSIFICHILFIAGYFKTSMWLNTGVPLFFVISGFLMSKKKIQLDLKGIVSFYKTRISKFYLPYAVYILSVSAVLFLIRKPPNLVGLFMYLAGGAAFAENGILGLGHLWFISVLLICYLQTPLLQFLKRRNRRMIGGIFATQFLLFLLLDKPSYGIHIATYAVGYYLGEDGKFSRHMTIQLGWLAAIFSMVRLLADTKFMAADYIIYYYYDALFQPVARFMLAMWIFCMAMQHTKNIESWAEKHKGMNKIIQQFSAASFEIYLTHQFIQLSVWEFLPHDGAVGMGMYIILSIVLTAMNTYALKLICSKIKGKIMNPFAGR